MEIVELRQYTMHPQQRDILIELFDRELIEPQEAEGMKVIGQFRDLDDPDRFVWLRGFPNMQVRAASLETFYYGGPVWQKHREAALATIIDASNVLLLRPAAPSSGFSLPRERPGRDAVDVPPGVVTATIYYFDSPVDGDFIEFFERTLQPEAMAHGAKVLAYFVSETRPNAFPRLPVREGEHVFVWFASFADEAEYGRHLQALAQSTRWSDSIAPELMARLSKPPEVLRLAATARSQLRP